jgi:hypothetical protein
LTIPLSIFVGLISVSFWIFLHLSFKCLNSQWLSLNFSISQSGQPFLAWFRLNYFHSRFVQQSINHGKYILAGFVYLLFLLDFRLSWNWLSYLAIYCS